MEHTKLVFTPPGPDAPGYLKRQRQALEFVNAINDKPQPETLDKMVVFLAQFVSEPEAHEDKLEALWMASQEQFQQLLAAITGGVENDANPTSPERVNAAK